MQSPLSSLIEQLLNVGTGFILSFVIQHFVIVPIWNINTTFSENLQITVVFTVVSIARGYAWRRIFNARLKRRLATYADT